MTQEAPSFLRIRTEPFLAGKGKNTKHLFMNIKHFIILCLAFIISIISVAQNNRKKVYTKRVATTKVGSKVAQNKKKTTTAYKQQKTQQRKNTNIRQTNKNKIQKKNVVKVIPQQTVAQKDSTISISQAATTKSQPTYENSNTIQEKKTKSSIGPKGKGEFDMNIGYDFLLQGSGGIFTFQPEYGWYISDQVYLGIGSGITTDDKFKSVSIPLFSRIEVCFLPDKKINPFFSLQGGYDIALSEDGNGRIRINPIVGFRTPVAKNTELMLGFGYTRIIGDNYGADLLGFKCGLSFNSKGKGVKNFLKKLDYNFELETYTPTSITYEDGKYENKATSFYGLRFSILSPIVSDCLYAGLSLGAGRYTFTDQIQNHREEVTKEIYANVMARVRYKAKQLSLGKSIYPFAQIDLGERGATPKDHISFVAIPTIGISMKTGKKQSLDASIGYDTNAIDGDMDKTSGSFRIALGYTL